MQAFVTILICISKYTMASLDDYLTHYWPITNGQLTDTIANANMYQGSAQAVQFAVDRFGVANEALDLNVGYTQVPPGVYLNAAVFSIAMWLNLKTVSANYLSILEVGAPSLGDYLVLAFNNGGALHLEIYENNIQVVLADSTLALAHDKWQLVLITYDGARIIVYINDKSPNIYYTFIGFSTSSINFTSNFIGHSNKIANAYGKFYLDDLRFYNTSLTAEQISSLLDPSIYSIQFYFIFKMRIIYRKLFFLKQLSHMLYQAHTLNLTPLLFLFVSLAIKI